MSARILRLAAGAIALAALASSCAATVRAGNPGLCRQDDPENRLSIPVPPVLGGLSVSIDQAGTKTLRKENRTNASYMCDGTVFSLRGGDNGKELKAVITLERLTSDADTSDPDFRTRIVGDIVKGTERKPERIGNTLVYKTKTNEQVMAIWFKERFMGIAMAREDQTTGIQGGVDFDRLLIEAISLDPVQT